MESGPVTVAAANAETVLIHSLPLCPLMNKVIDLSRLPAAHQPKPGCQAQSSVYSGTHWNEALKKEVSKKAEKKQ